VATRDRTRAKIEGAGIVQQRTGLFSVSPVVSDSINCYPYPDALCAEGSPRVGCTNPHVLRVGPSRPPGGMGGRMKRSQREIDAIKDRVKRFGLRCICQVCMTEQRHYAAQGRLRNTPCQACGMNRLRAVWWVEKFHTKAIAERKQLRSAYPDLQS